MNKNLIRLSILFTVCVFMLTFGSVTLFAADVVPDIKANNSDGPITIGTGDTLSIALSLDPGSNTGTSAVWYIAVNTPSGWQSFDLTQMNYTSGLSPSLQNVGLISFGLTGIFSTSNLSAGTYTYYFAIDLSGQFYFDSVTVTVSPASQSSSLLNITPGGSFMLAIGGEIELKAEVFDGSGLLMSNTANSPVIVTWKSSDESVVSVDDEGVASGVNSGTATITAQTGNSITTVTITVEFSDMVAILLSPSRIAMDIGSDRTFDVTAVDVYGSPTTLDCIGGVELEFDDTYYDATFNDTSGAETVDVSGLQKGYSLLTLDCGGFKSSPVIIEVKPSVTIPNPSSTADFGIQPDLAVDGTDIHITSYDQTNNKLIYTYFDGSWSSETIDGDGSYGKSSQVVLDPLNKDRPIMCALEDTYLTCWTVTSSGFWDKQQVEEIAFSFEGYNSEICSAASNSGVIYVFYIYGGELKMAISNNSSRNDWLVSTVQGKGKVKYIDAAISTDNLPRLAFQAEDNAYYGVLSSTDEWSFELIDDSFGAGTGIRLALGDNNRPQAVYYKNGSLINAEKENGVWRTAVIETIETDENYSFGFGVDRHSLPRVSYYDSDSDTLKYAYKLRSERLGMSNRWRFESPSSNTSVGLYNELVIDEYGRVQITYYDSSNNEVKYYVEPNFLDYSETDTSENDDVSNLEVTEPISVPGNIIWDMNKVLGQNGSYGFAGIYAYDNLTIEDDVEVTSSGISQIILNISGTLTLGRNAVIRVRNGYYPEAPMTSLETVEFVTGIPYKIYANTYGIGGNGGSGSAGSGCGWGNMSPNGEYRSAPGGGGGGYGGGGGGSGSSGDNGGDNGENGGGSGYGGSAGEGGGAVGLGGHAGGRYGGGGNGGNGSSDGACSGGGGGGYGGGVLTIIADEIIYDSTMPPQFLVSGQKGGSPRGVNGQGGLVIIECPNYDYSSNHWNLDDNTYGEHTTPSTNGGHGIVTGNPYAVYVNGVEQVSEE